MSEFGGKTVQAIQAPGVLYDATDVDTEFGPSVELHDADGAFILVYQVEAFRADGLYEIVDTE